jgi:hypothetical protein
MTQRPLILSREGCLVHLDVTARTRGESERAWSKGPSLRKHKMDCDLTGEWPQIGMWHGGCTEPSPSIWKRIPKKKKRRTKYHLVLLFQRVIKIDNAFIKPAK